ncbi:MAG: hypothetical protein ABMB14_35935 [Myxococcota bacterium]
MTLLFSCSGSGTTDPSADASSASDVPECEVYVACALGSALPAEELAAVLDVYGDDGTCFDAASPDACAEACVDGTVELVTDDLTVEAACLDALTGCDRLAYGWAICPDLAEATYFLTCSDLDPTELDCVVAAIDDCTGESDALGPCLGDGTGPGSYTEGTYTFELTAVHDPCGSIFASGLSEEEWLSLAQSIDSTLTLTGGDPIVGVVDLGSGPIGPNDCAGDASGFSCLFVTESSGESAEITIDAAFTSSDALSGTLETRTGADCVLYDFDAAL